MRRRIFPSFCVMLLLMSLMLGSLSCHADGPEAAKLMTRYTEFSSAKSVSLDTSAQPDLELMYAEMCGEDIVVLSRLADSLQMLFYDRQGNFLSSANPIPIEYDRIVYDIFCPDDSKVSMVSGTAKMNESLDGFLYNDLMIRTFDRDGGAQSEEVVIPYDFSSHEPTVIHDSAGDIYVSDDTSVTCYHPDGSVVFRNEYKKSVSLRRIGDVPAVQADSKFLPAASGNTDFSEADNVEQVYLYAPEDCSDGLFLYNTAGVFAYDFDKKEEIMVLRWNDSDIDYAYASSKTYVLKKDIFLVTQYTSEGKQILTLVLPSTDAPVVGTVDGKEKTVITIAGCVIIEEPRSEVSYLMTACKAYQEAHPDVEIKVIDYYGEYGERGETQLCLDILTDNAADLYFYTPYDFEVEEEIAFADLNPMLSADPDFSKEDYYWKIVSACQTGDQLFSMPISFCIPVTYGPEELLGDRTSWTLAEYMALDDTLPDGFTLSAGGKSSQVLSYYLGQSIDTFIDPLTGEVDFENEDFYIALEYAKKFALYGEVAGERLNNDAFVLSSWPIGNIQGYSQIFTNSREPVALIGAPETGGGIQANIDHYMSVSAASKHPELAWDIMKFFLSEDMQTMTLGHFESYVYGIPLNREAAVWQIDWLGRDSDDYQEYEETYLSLVDSVDEVQSFNINIRILVEEEAPAYFLGQKSAEDLAKVLESRINLMLAEDD